MGVFTFKIELYTYMYGGNLPKFISEELDPESLITGLMHLILCVPESE